MPDFRLYVTKSTGFFDVLIHIGSKKSGGNFGKILIFKQHVWFLITFPQLFGLFQFYFTRKSQKIQICEDPKITRLCSFVWSKTYPINLRLLINVWPANMRSAVTYCDQIAKKTKIKSRFLGLDNLGLCHLWLEDTGLRKGQQLRATRIYAPEMYRVLNLF